FSAGEVCRFWSPCLPQAACRAASAAGGGVDECERRRVLAEIDPPPILDDMGEVPAALEHGDVGDRIALEHDDIGKLARLQFTDLALEADGEGIALGGDRDRLERREARIFHQDLQLLRVQRAPGHKAVVAAVGAAEQPDAELFGALHQADDIIESRFMRFKSSCTCSGPTRRPSSSTCQRKVAVGRMGMPALATASRSASVARSAWTIQSTPASAAARVEPAPRE